MRRTLSILSTMIAGGKRATGRTLGSHSKYDFGESWLVGRETRRVSRLWVTCHDCTQGFWDLFLQSSCLGLHQDHATLAGKREWAICDFRAHVAHWPSVEQATHDNPWALLTQRYEKEGQKETFVLAFADVGVVRRWTALVGMLPLSVVLGTCKCPNPRLATPPTALASFAGCKVCNNIIKSLYEWLASLFIRRDRPVQVTSFVSCPANSAYVFASMGLSS